MERLYIITRSNLTPGLQAAQAVHAAFSFALAEPDLCRRWHDESNFLVVLSVPDLDALEALRSRLDRKGLPCLAVNEPDLDDELTAIVLHPFAGAGRWVSGISLALKEPRMVA